MSDERWKGEHLIRAVRREPHQGAGLAFGTRKRPRRSGPAAKAAQSRSCAVPGCHRVLYPGNKSGVCRIHAHAAFHCRCPRCAAGLTRP